MDRPGEGEARFEREIVFDRVSFRYGNGDPVLSDVSFTLPKGKVVALVGPSPGRGRPRWPTCCRGSTIRPRAGS